MILGLAAKAKATVHSAGQRRLRIGRASSELCLSPTMQQQLRDARALLLFLYNIGTVMMTLSRDDRKEASATSARYTSDENATDESREI